MSDGLSESEDETANEVQDLYQDAVGKGDRIEDLSDNEHNSIIHDANDICSKNGIRREKWAEVISEGLRCYMMEQMTQQVDSEVKRYREDLKAFYQ